MSKLTPRRYSGVAWWVVAITFILWCVLSLRADLARISFTPLLRSWHVMLLVMLLTSAAYLLRAARWTWYLRRLNHPLGFGFSLLTYVAGFAFTLSPAKVGEVMRFQFYQRDRIPLQDVAAVVFVERLMDVLAVAAMGALIVGALPGYEKAAWTGVVLLIAGWVIVGQMRRLVSWGFNESRFAALRRAGEWMSTFLLKTEPLLGARMVAAASLIGVCAWSLEGIGLFIIGAAMGASFDVSLALGIYGAAMLIGAISFLPGGLGSTEAAMTAALVADGNSLGDALLITLCFRFLTLWFGVALGWIATIFLRRRLLGQ